MGTLISVIITAVFTNNFITKQTLGICPFLGVSKNTKSAVGMGVAVTAVMALATLVTYPIYTWVMVPLGFGFLEIIFFIFIIASLVQMLEAIIRKVSPSLYSAMGIYLPLITTNCVVLGVTEMMIGDMSSVFGSGLSDGATFGWAILYALFSGIGYTLVMIIMSGCREKLAYYKIPKAMTGFPISMITASLICMAFYVFSLVQL